MTQSVFIRGPLPGLNDFISTGSRFAYNNKKKQWMRTIGQEIILAKLKPMQRAAIEFRWQEKDRRRNPDNIISMGTKFFLDALVIYGILPNDGWDEIASLSNTFRVDATNPGVLVTLREEAV